MFNLTTTAQAFFNQLFARNAAPVQEVEAEVVYALPLELDAAQHAAALINWLGQSAIESEEMFVTGFSTTINNDTVALEAQYLPETCEIVYTVGDSIFGLNGYSLFVTTDAQQAADVLFVYILGLGK